MWESIKSLHFGMLLIELSDIRSDLKSMRLVFFVVAVVSLQFDLHVAEER